MNAKELAARLKTLRLERDLSFAQLAAAVGLTTGAVWKIINCHVEPSERSLFKLKKAFPEIFKSAA